MDGADKMLLSRNTVVRTSLRLRLERKWAMNNSSCVRRATRPRSSSASSTTRQLQPLRPGRPPSPAMSQVDPVLATVLYDFNAGGPNEVSVRRGERVRVLYHVDERWLFVIRRDNQFGYVPYLYAHLNVPSGSSRIPICSLDQYLEHLRPAAAASVQECHNTSLMDDSSSLSSLTSLSLSDNSGGPKTTMLQEAGSPSGSVSSSHYSKDSGKDSARHSLSSADMVMVGSCCSASEISPPDNFRDPPRPDAADVSLMPDLVISTSLECIDRIDRLPTSGGVSTFTDTPVAMPLLGSAVRLSASLNSLHTHTTVSSSTTPTPTKFLETCLDSDSDPEPLSSPSSTHKVQLRGESCSLAAINKLRDNKERPPRRVTFTEKDEVIGTARADIDRTSVPPALELCQDDLTSSEESTAQLYKTVVNADPKSGIDRFTLV